jgi:hypothetical protein
MKNVLIFIVRNLKRLLIYLDGKTLIENKNIEDFASLAPRILKSEEDLKGVQPYLLNLAKAINTDSINNIALTGSYGSGKSTILKTFQFHHPEYNYLNISLASFKDNKDDKDDFERKLEVSILQQIFYHVDPLIIPDSRFKRIINLTTKKLTLATLFLLLWVVSTIILLKFGYINKLNPNSWSNKLKIDWLTVLLFWIFLAGIGSFAKSIIRLFSNSKITKFNIKGEVELGEANDKSVFNQHLEEILYYFERTSFNVVIIEDVDRFNSTDIFTKLREINILINNSDLIKRKVSFVYAIKDEMFKDSNERVKFFEFIIPIIPFINPSNASDQLTKLITNANLGEILSVEFTNDVITFIDDIDMRLLINIFQEYQLYRTSLNKALQQDNLFAIIVYKNMFPDDFGELPKRKGKIYSFLSNKSLYISGLKEDIQVQISDIDKSINQIEAETERPIKELRAIYINHLSVKLDRFYKFFVNGEVTVLEALEDNNFNIIKKSSNLVYMKYAASQNYHGDFRIYGNTNSNIPFSSIEKDISDLTYDQREKNLLDKSNGKINKLKIERELLKNKITELESLNIQEIFEQVNIDKYLGDFKENYLIRNLLLNGYINENYNDYISVFHEINLTQSDFAFEARIKSGITQPFDCILHKTDNILKRLSEKYFKREVILNYNLLDTLLSERTKYTKKIDNFFKLLSLDTEKNFQFILTYISRNPKDIKVFIEMLVSTKQSFWTYLINKSGLATDRVNEIVKLIFEYASFNSISALDEKGTLKLYLEKLENPIEFTSTFKNQSVIKKFITENKILIDKIDLPQQKPNNILDFIYDNNSYKISSDNILTILKYKLYQINETEFYSANFTTVKNLSAPVLLAYLNTNIEIYVEDVLLEIPENINESEEAIVFLLNNKTLSKELKNNLIIKQNCILSNIGSIDELEIKGLSLLNNKVKPIWENVFDYLDGLDELKFDTPLIDYFNSAINYIPLSLIRLDEVKNKDEEYITSFCATLIYCNLLEFNAYTNLLKSIPYTYENLDYKQLYKEKVLWMLLNNFLILTVNNFNGIKEDFSSLHIKLLEVYEEDFIKKYSDFPLDVNDWFLLFSSSLIKIESKLEIIKNFDDNVIIQNPKIARIVCDLLPENEYVSLRYEVLDAMFKTDASILKKCTLLNIHFENLNNEQIQGLTEKLGDDYGRLFIKQNKPSFANKPYNLKLIENLQSKSLISSFSIDKEKNEIKVVANY